MGLSFSSSSAEWPLTSTSEDIRSCHFSLCYEYELTTTKCYAYMIYMGAFVAIPSTHLWLEWHLACHLPLLQCTSICMHASSHCPDILGRENLGY